MMKSIPLVYEGHLDSLSSQEFNSVKIHLTAKLDSDLQWDKQLKEAQEITKKGFNILWDIDLGLFSELPLPLSDTTQYKSLHLALDHFFETVWKEFESNTIGAVLFKGPLDLVKKWIWDPDQVLHLRNELSQRYQNAQSFHNKSGILCNDLLEIEPKDLEKNEYGKNLLHFFCLTSALDYLEILAAQFPPDLLPYVLFDAQSIESNLHCYQLLDYEAFDFIQVALKNAPIVIPHGIGWQSAAYPNGFIGDQLLQFKKPAIEPNIGILVSSRRVLDPQLLKSHQALVETLATKGNIRYLSERNLTLEWEGLDTLVVFEIEEMTKRKLEGFIAAGGEVVQAGPALHLSQEKTIAQLKKQLEI